MADTTSHLSKRHKKERRLVNPPKFFDEARTKVWDDVLDRCPLDLRIEHRDIVVQYVLLVYDVERDQKPLKSSDMRLLRDLAMDLGMMPDGRAELPSKPKKAAKKEAEPAEEPKNTTFTRFKTPSRPKAHK